MSMLTVFLLYCIQAHLQRTPSWTLCKNLCPQTDECHLLLSLDFLSTSTGQDL